LLPLGRDTEDALQLLDDSQGRSFLRYANVDLVFKKVKLLRRDIETIVADLHEVELEVIDVGEGNSAHLSQVTV